MTIDFQFTPDDYRNAFRAHFKKGASLALRLMLHLCLIAGILMLLIGILFVITGQRAPNVALPPFVFGSLFTWYGIGGPYQFLARKEFAKSPSNRQPRRIEVSEAGVKTDAGVASSNMSWEAYLRFVESKDCFLLYTSPGCFAIVPKRALQPEQVNELRQILQSNVGKQAAAAAR